MRLKKKTLKEFMGVVVIIIVTTLPFFHDFITERGVGTRPWVPVIGAEDFLTDNSGKVMGFSSYRVFLYTVLIHLFAHIGFLGWMMDAKGKSYRIALFVPVILSGYTVIVFIFNAKETAFNAVSTKFYITIILTLAVFLFYFIDRRNKLNLQKSETNHANSEMGS